MSEEMQSKVFEIVSKTISKPEKPVQIAAFLKKEMDKEYGPTWHCIVGKSFGSFVSHESGCFIHFYVDTLAILLFKTS
ncbi:hypothetical protein CANARDRAFT_30051 [[Candida] arabinofermentans NRRL YB-2248]|uniref:Dynein light chain n=1 Tax=[Candida] arabinofermentans NRRL YB-2248 TaxID=983967 RepID=A0A1E4SUT5_9ASCO|nr:hypothetical protein CANARDRAFT_30051 [[Candida] arabinofermentans NRRL YB-2248]